MANECVYLPISVLITAEDFFRMRMQEVLQELQSR